MLLMEDMQLLRAYVEQGSEDAFKTILDRHLNLVYSTALRQVRDPVLASEVTQTTFIILARKAGSLGSGTILAGWLYRTAQFAASRALRTEARRRERETEAAQMQTETHESMWEHLAPILDQAMAHLGAADRNAVVLRYFENKTAKDVGAALGINEAAAQKRLSRAVDKLRAFCTSKGVVLSAAGLTTLLSANAVQSAPSSVALVTAAALKGGAAAASTSSLTSGTLKLIAWSKLKVAAWVGLGAATVAIGTAAFIAHQRSSQPRFQNRPLNSWMAELDNHDPNFSSQMYWVPWQEEMKLSPAQIQALQAIQAMGTNAVPTLIAAIDKNDFTQWDRLMGRTPGELLDRHREAAVALSALGPACEPWVADFDRILQAGRSPKEAAIALAAMGPKGWEVLMRTTTNNLGDPSVCSIWALGSFKVKAPGVEEVLLASSIKNKPTGNDIVALWALSEITEDRQQLVPYLVEGLKATRQDMKWGSCVVLGHLGKDAWRAVPALEELLHDRNPLVRHDAAQALEQVKPLLHSWQPVTSAHAVLLNANSWQASQS